MITQALTGSKFPGVAFTRMESVCFVPASRHPDLCLWSTALVGGDTSISHALALISYAGAGIEGGKSGIRSIRSSERDRCCRQRKCDHIQSGLIFRQNGQHCLVSSPAEA